MCCTRPWAGCSGKVAREAAISPFHFIRQFEAVFGVTPHQYRIGRRIERAKHLLAAGQHSVTDVCMEVGFSSLGSFSIRPRTSVKSPLITVPMGAEAEAAPAPTDRRSSSILAKMSSYWADACSSFSRPRAKRRRRHEERRRYSTLPHLRHDPAPAPVPAAEVDADDLRRILVGDQTPQHVDERVAMRREASTTRRWNSSRVIATLPRSTRCIRVHPVVPRRRRGSPRGTRREPGENGWTPATSGSSALRLRACR